jgi:hypothetical protein
MTESVISLICHIAAARRSPEALPQGLPHVLLAPSRTRFDAVFLPRASSLIVSAVILADREGIAT